jgi:DNA helicase-2/ATP-dependent DNA helicase PcrA
LRKLKENIDVDLGDGKELVQIISEIARFSPLRFVEALLGETGLRDSVRDSDFSKHLDIAVRVVEEALDEGAREYGQLSDVLSMEWERLEAKVLREEDSVKLMTIHKSKGLEFPVVYVIRVEEGNIPRIRKDSIPNIPEERRLLYVAITRSMEKVIMSHSKYKYNNNDRNFSSQSSFLDEISRCNLETI